MAPHEAAPDAASRAAPTASDTTAALPRRWRRVLPWATLVALLVVAQTLLVWLTVSYENTRAQEQVEAASAGVAAEVRQLVGRDLQGLQALLWNDPSATQWRADGQALLRRHPELLRVERRERRDGGDRAGSGGRVGRDLVVDAVESPYHPPLFERMRREDIDFETELACATALRQASPAFSRSYFVPQAGGLGVEVIDVCMPVLRAGVVEGFMAGTLAMQGLLAEAASPELLRSHELSFVEGDGTRLARAGLVRGGGVYTFERLIDLPGQSLQLRLDSAAGSPRLIPNLAVALVLGLSLALGVVVVLLVRDVRRRAVAEAALAEALAFRRAMEDSLITGLRARDLQGRVTYANLSFCRMVGFAADEIIGRDPPPYWPPELAGEYTRRQVVRLGALGPSGDSREGFETTFMRRSGERFAVLIFEAPLVDGQGRHTGWMSAVLDVSEQRRVEELSRQQTERLSATARLATVGEMASLLSHELNQPLAAIASYAAGSLNLMNEPAGSAVDVAERGALLRQAAERIAEQAERAGRVIKSVHDFVRRREQAHEPIRSDLLIDAVLPLVRLQARKSGTRVEVDLPTPPPRVFCDRTMVEQVLLNLTRNGIQAMEADTPPERRELRIAVRQTHADWVTLAVTDRGPGIAAEVAGCLFTPFFTTRSEGMGLGLSLCRTVVEQHGGALDFRPAPSGGTEFRFTLPANPPERKIARLRELPNDELNPTDAT